MNKRERKHLMEVYGSTKVLSMLPNSGERTLRFNTGMNWAYTAVARNSGLDVWSLELEVMHWAKENCPAIVNSTECVLLCDKCEHIPFSDKIKSKWGV